MANIKSAKKRINTINRQKTENKLIKSTLSTYVKKFKALLNSGEIEKAEAQLKETISYIDSACTKGVIHKNNASRKVARLSAALDSAKKKVQPAKAEVKKEVKAEAPAKVEVKAEEKVEKKTRAKKAVKEEAEVVEKKTRKTTKKAETK